MFEFIESRWGKEGLRQYLFALRKSVIGGGDDAYEEAFKLKADEFDQQFERYLKDRFKPFRDKERPADYGRNLAPNPEKTPFNQAVSAEPSPSGDLIAVASGNRKDGELDIILVSAKDGSVIRNLTNGFDQDKGFEYITSPGGRFNTVPWMSWSPSGDRLAYFVRAEKIADADRPERPEPQHRAADRDARRSTIPNRLTSRRTARRSCSPRLQSAVGDMFIVDLETQASHEHHQGQLRGLGADVVTRRQLIVYVARVSGNEKLFQLDLADRDENADDVRHARRRDGAVRGRRHDRLSVHRHRSEPADRSRRLAERQHLQHLDAQPEELASCGSTPTRSAATSRRSSSHQAGNRSQIGFVSYYKGDYELHVLERKDPIITAASADFGAPGPIIDFQAPLTHTLIAAQQAEEGRLREAVPRRPAAGERRRDERRRRVRRIGGHLQRRAGRQAVQPLRAVDLAVPHAVVLVRQPLAPLQLRGPGLLADAVLLRPARRTSSTIRRYRGDHRPRPGAWRRARCSGGTVFGIYPFNRYRRVELSAACCSINE